MSDQQAIRVRFAPSPTGHLHVGGARTALFNWLYARKTGGAFVLRIEDTDQRRSTEESYAAILRGLEWLELDWDEGPRVGGDRGPYLQSQRLEIYREHVERLRGAGLLYPCYCTTEEIAARNEARGEVATAGYDGHCRELTRERIAAYEAEGRRPSWRLRTPDEGETFWYDIVVGKREFANASLTDRVVLKQDGFPTYNLAVVVDDHLMGISHVLRGDDHISNTPFQLLIYDAFGWPRPKFGHMPMILGPDRKRLSKRHGATSVEEFREQGILPDAMVNYLALLGWSPGGSGDEVLSRSELIRKFSLKKVNSSPAAFDYDKLAHINAQHLKRLPREKKVDLALATAAERGWAVESAWRVPAADLRGYLDRIVGAMGGRFSSLTRLPGQLACFFTEDYPVDAGAVAEHLGAPEARELLAALADRLEAALPPDAPAGADLFEQAVRETAAAADVPAGAVIHPTRVALTGQAASAGIFEVMELVGGPRVLARLRRAAAGG